MKNGRSSPRSTNGSALDHGTAAPRKRGMGSGGRAAPRRVPMARTPAEARAPGRRSATAAEARAPARRSPDHALDLLAADHARAADLFDRLARLKSTGPQKAQLAARLTDELEVHARIEEELFYPSIRLALGPTLVTRAIDEHASVRELVSDLRALAPGDAAFEETLATLRDCVEQHVREEEGELFPRVRALDLDLAALGRAMKARRRQLKSEGEAPALAGLATFPGMIVT